MVIDESTIEDWLGEIQGIADWKEVDLSTGIIYNSNLNSPHIANRYIAKSQKKEIALCETTYFLEHMIGFYHGGPGGRHLLNGTRKQEGYR